MRHLSFLILLLMSTASYAGCSQIASVRTETLLVDIGNRGCDTQVDMILFATKKLTESDFDNFKKVPFLFECTLTKDGFRCRPNGKTPLAGATYRRIKFGRSQNACDEAGELGEKYICIKGCGKPNIPEYLNGFDGSC
jgi:hypothetical protein